MIRSNKEFSKIGLEKRIQYEIQLSTSRNKDFVIRHPNETKEKNSTNWKKELTDRVKKEEDSRQLLLKSRLEKRTGFRRLNNLEPPE